MLNYIIRRILLMIPTLIGITLLVFMLIALSPGGIGAALMASGGGAMQSSSSIAITRAKLEDRYGLNEPALIQYTRWLARISPIKFGQRDLVTPAGDLISKPRPIPTPAGWQWFDSTLPDVPTPTPEQISAQFPADDDPKRAEAFRTVERNYTDARATFTAADANLRDAFKRYVESANPPDAWSTFLRNQQPIIRRIIAQEPDRSVKEFAELEKLSAQARAAWANAATQRALLVAAMGTRPYPEAGFGISGVVSVAWPDLGTAFSVQRPVIDLIGEHLPVTLLLNIIAFPIIYLIAIPSGMLAAVRKGTWADVGLGGIYIGFYSVPVVLAGALALGFLATPEYLNAFPTSAMTSKSAESMTFLPSFGADGFSRGYLLDLLWHLVLPVVCIVYGGFAVLSKQTRAAMLENFNADYVRTAKAKGVSNRDVIFAHVFRNSLLPLITMFVTIFPAMLAGSVVIERIFSIPGMGYMLIEAISQRDREIILANTTIIALVNLLALLAADILYATADPRIAYK